VPPEPAPPALTIGFTVAAPLAGSTFYLGADEAPIVGRWALNASIPNALGGVNVTLIRRLPSGDSTAIAVLASGLDPAAGLASIALTNADLLASLLPTSGYALRFSVAAPAYNASAAAESGAFTLAWRPRLTLTAPAAGDVTEGDAITVSWTSVNVAGGLRLEFVDASGTAVGAPIAENIDAAPATGPASYTFTAATSWGVSMPLRVRATSLARPDVFSSSPVIRILRKAFWLEITRTDPSASTMTVFNSPTASVTITWAQSEALAATEDNGEVTLRCGGDPAVVATLEPQQLAALTWTWTPAAGTPTEFAGINSARSCVIRVRSVNRPDIFHDSTPFALVKPAAPRISLTAPAPSATGITAAVGGALPLAWTASGCAGVLNVNLDGSGGAASGGVPNWVTATDVGLSGGSLPALTVPLSTPTGSYDLTLTAAAAAGSGTVSSLPQAITITPPAFAFGALPEVVTTGSDLIVTYTTPLPCGTPITLSVLADTTAGGRVIQAFSSPDYTACTPSVTLSVPADLVVGDYQLQASSSAVPSLARVSSVFRVVAPASILITYPNAQSRLPAGGSVAIAWNSTGYSTTSRFQMSLLRCRPGTAKTAVGTGCVANYTLSGADGVQNLGSLQWPILPIIEANVPWPPEAEAIYFLRATSLANPTAPYQLSEAFRIIPALPNVIMHVTLAPLSNGVLHCHTPDPARVSWTVLGGSTLYALELWQERYYYTGGDTLLLNVTGNTPVAALDGPYNYMWQNLPVNLPSVEPVYLRVIAMSGPYAGTWGRSDMFYLDSLAHPGLPEFQDRYCRNAAGSHQSSAAAHSAAATWAALCAANCAECAAAEGQWATGSHVVLSFVQPTDSTLGTTELQRLSNTLGAFTQTTGVCLPGDARRASSADISDEVPLASVAPFRVGLGLLPGMAAQLATLKPDGALSANLTANLYVVPADISLTCDDMDSLVITNIDITVPASNVSSVISAVQNAYSNVTNLGSSSSVVVVRSSSAANGDGADSSSRRSGRRLAVPAALGHDSHTSSCRSGRRLQPELSHPAAAPPAGVPLVLPGINVMSLALGGGAPAPPPTAAGAVAAFFRGGACARALAASAAAPTPAPPVTLRVTVTTLAPSQAKAESTVSLLEAAQKSGRLPGTITSSTAQSPSVLAESSTSSSQPQALYAPAVEENRAYAGVGDSAQSSTAYTQTGWRAKLAQLWRNFKSFATKLWQAALDNLLALIALPVVVMLVGWCLTTYVDAPRRAAWMKSLARDTPQDERQRYGFRAGCCLGYSRKGIVQGGNPYPQFDRAVVGDSVPVRGPPGALSPMEEPFGYVVVYEAVLRALAATGLPVLRNWAPPPRPYQGALEAQRIKNLQPFRVGKVLTSTEATHVADRASFQPMPGTHNPMYTSHVAPLYGAPTHGGPARAMSPA